MDNEYLRFCPRLKAMLDSGFAENADGESVEISAASTVNNIRVIREILKAKKPTKTLEVGLAFGASALTILATLQEVSEDAAYHHTAIDPFQSKLWGGSSIRAIADEGWADHFQCREEFSSLALATAVQSKERYDFIYIDGSHLFEDVFLDFYYSAILLNEGGVVLFDDCSDKHVAKVIRFIDTNYSGILEPLDLSPFEDPNKALKKKVGNWLGIRQLRGFTKTSAPPSELGRGLC